MRQQDITPVGDQIREWRGRRRISQLNLALDIGISQRHLSFVESGRSKPSKDVIMMLAERLDIPLRERNRLLLGADYAPAFPERDMNDEDMAAVREAMQLVLKGHEPFPALTIDRYWNMVSANRMVSPLLANVTPELLDPPVNVMRLSLHPQGLAPLIDNFAEWRQHMFSRLQRQIDASADPDLVALYEELTALDQAGAHMELRASGKAVTPMILNTQLGKLSLFSTTTVFGTPLDVTVSELAIEAFYPADPGSAEILRQIADSLNVA